MSATMIHASGSHPAGERERFRHPPVILAHTMGEIDRSVLGSVKTAHVKGRSDRLGENLVEFAHSVGGAREPREAVGPPGGGVHG